MKNRINLLIYLLNNTNSYQSAGLLRLQRFRLTSTYKLNQLFVTILQGLKIE